VCEILLNSLPYIFKPKMSLKSKIDAQRLPEHIAIIMDGNGRWAKEKGKFRIFGHQNGVKSVREATEAAAELGVKYLTLYAFSTENWNRPKLEVNALMTLLVRTINKEIRKEPKPYLLELMTFRMRGHEESSGTKYYPEGLQEQWALKDPVSNYELYLKEEGILSESLEQEIKNSIKEEIQLSFEQAQAEGQIDASLETELNDVYAHFNQNIIMPTGSKTEKRFIDAIQEALIQSMEKFPELVLMGQDIAEYGGAFKVTEGLVDRFGKDRVRNTPLCESAIVGASLGLSISGMKAMVEMQFADFVTCGFNQIINNLAKIHWRWGQNAVVVVRMPTGAGTAAGPFHSQSNEAWFVHTPGLKVVYPSSPSDAKGLLNAAIEDPNPVIFFEHKFLYRSLKEEVDDQYFTVEIGKAKSIKSGTDLTIITYGLGVHWAQQLAEARKDLSIEILDLRTLLPLDQEAVFEAVKKTGKVIVLHEDCMTGGIGGELVALITENCFEYWIFINIVHSWDLEVL
jgi:2-oxoisovalerate dehydrogenase E1 component